MKTVICTLPITFILVKSRKLFLGGNPKMYILGIGLNLNLIE